MDTGASTPGTGAGAQPRPATFRDAGHEAAYRADGFVVLPLLTAEELARAIEVATPLVPAGLEEFRATLYDPDVDYRTRVDRALRPPFAAALDRAFVGQRCFVANLLVKPPGPQSELGVHQDWTFVDEAVATSATVWCPLVDVDDGNGTLTLYRGSHLLAESWRGSPRLPTPFDGLEGTIRDGFGTSITCPAGHAVVYDHRTVHWSGPNLTATPRLAVGIGIAPVGQPLVHLHAGPDGAVTRYDVDDDFLLDITFGQPPSRVGGATPVDVPARTLVVAELRSRELGVPGPPIRPAG